MARGILKLKDLGVDQKYLTLKPSNRKLMCKEIITQTFARMSVNASEEMKIKTMKSVLLKSIDHYENEEAYEECTILFDLLKTLDEY